MNLFEEFWPHYLREHASPLTRWVHFIGTTLAIGAVVGIVVMRAWWWLFAVPVIGYGFAWVSHLTIEKNRPATFRYPLWSLLGDLKMWGLMATGRLGRELESERDLHTGRKVR